ncbi:MAG: sigma-70 family RNA polymerase sigma factor [Tannerella sp.]|jgi:RNA polymerase sigma-70 factor (ECF subfamily)|nr:sigma-70 family RNA polymerase sigma factor [Tannerella sp.]
MELDTFVIHVVPLREKLHNFSRKITGNNADAEDVVQEIFLKLWSMREELDGYNSVEALAMQMTKNFSLDKLKSRKTLSDNEFDTLNIVSKLKTPAEETEERNSVEYVRQLISQLPYLQQTIMRMKDIEGYELSEIAEITGSQIEAVRTNLSRARKKIREQLLKAL